MIRRLRRFWQRGTRGWSDEDAWNLEHYLARVIADSVDYLNQNGISHRCYGKDQGDWSFSDCKDCQCETRYHVDLTTIAYGFRRWADYRLVDLLQDGVDTNAEYQRLEKDVKAALALFADNFTHLWD